MEEDVIGELLDWVGEDLVVEEWISCIQKSDLLCLLQKVFIVFYLLQQSFPQMFQHNKQPTERGSIEPILTTKLKLLSQLFGWVTIVDKEIVGECFASCVPDDLV